MGENNKYRYMRAAAHLTQFGLNMVSPIILCIVAALWIKTKFGTGSWVVICAIILGVAAAGLNMFTFIKQVSRETGGRKGDEERKD